MSLVDKTGRRRPPWQAGVIREGMAKTAEGKWASREVGVLASRQNGKNGAIEEVEIGWMVDEPGVQILHTAHKYKTAMKAMKRLVLLLKASPALWAKIKKNGIRYANGAESIEFENGSTIHYSTRTNQGGRGESYDRIVFDEAMVLSEAAYAAIKPLLTTADQPGREGPGGQAWFLGSAADSDSQEHCGQWSSLRDRAHDKEPRLLWLEWSAPEPPEGATRQERAAWRADRHNWALANPSLGYLITEEYIEDELRSARASLEKWEIERLSVGRWPKPFTEHDPVIDGSVWRDMSELKPTVRGPIAISLDMTSDLSTCALSAATKTAGDRIRIELGYHGSPSDIVERVVDIIHRWNPCAFVINSSSPARAFVARFVELGIEPVLSTASDAAAADVGFVEDAQGRRLSHAGDERIDDAVATVRKRELSGGRFTWDYTEGDVTTMRTVSLARWGLLTYGPLVRPKQAPTQDVASGTDVDDDALMSAGF